MVMASNALANIEALLNIAANLGEIIGITTGIKLLIGSAVVSARKLGRAKQWLFTALGILAVGLAAPGLTNILVDINLFLGLIVSWTVACFLVVFAWHVWWLPVTIAKTDGQKHPIMFFFTLISGVGFFALGWFVCLFLACKERTDAAHAAGSAVPPVVTKLFNKITGRTGRETLGCGQDHLATAPADEGPR
jgi:hypothetical protein